MSDEGIQFLGSDRLPRTVGVTNPLPVDIQGATLSLDADGGIAVNGKAYRAQLDITRPANVTAYAANSVIGTGSGDDAIHTLENIGPSGGFIIIQSIELLIGASAISSGMTTFRLQFFTGKPAAAANGSTYGLPSSDRAVFVGFVEMGTIQSYGQTLFMQADYSGKLIKLAPGSTSLFCMLQTVGGFTPAANSELYSLRVGALEAGL